MRYKCNSKQKIPGRKNTNTAAFIYNRLVGFGLSEAHVTDEPSIHSRCCNQTESCTHTAGEWRAANTAGRRSTANTVGGSSRTKTAGSGCNNRRRASGTPDTRAEAGILALLRRACYFAPRVRLDERSA